MGKGGRGSEKRTETVVIVYNSRVCIKNFEERKLREGVLSLFSLPLSFLSHFSLSFLSGDL